jgi:hypothetical protein
LLAQLHAPDLAYHFHGDHLLALLLKYSAEQLNTLVNFESALLGLDGQFSVGVNIRGDDDGQLVWQFASQLSLVHGSQVASSGQPLCRARLTGGVA